MAAMRKSKAGLGLLLHDDYISITTLDVKAAKNGSCVICLDDDIDPHLMFSIDKCGHWFCLNCVKQHIEVKLLDGKIPDCLQHRCESQLSIDRCCNFLTQKLSLMWAQRIREDSIPSDERVYCPNPRCSYMMSKTELLSFSGCAFRRCFKCSASFCIYCKVPWHSKLSCTDYKKLHSILQDDDAKLQSLANRKGWRQCSKCQHMVELSYGCNHMSCRCGYEFCYTCGAQWNSRSHGKCISYRFDNEVPDFLCVLCLALLVVVMLYMFR